MGSYKEQNGTTRVGDFLRNIGGSASTVLSAAGSLTGQPWLNAIGSAIGGNEALTEEQKEKAFRLLQLDYDDLANARNMQVEALKQTDTFSKRFVYYLAFVIVFAAFFCLGMLFFYEVPETNRDLVNICIGVVFGTGLSGVITFFYGSSAGQEKK